MSPAKDKPATKSKKASNVQTNRHNTTQQSISKLSEIKVGTAIPTKKTKKKKEEDLPSSELYSFPSISQIRKMTPLKASATPLEKAADRSFSMSTGSEVFGSVAHTENINKQRETEPEPTSPTFVPESEPDKESVGFKSKSNRSYIEEITREQQRKKEETARADERKTQLK